MAIGAHAAAHHSAGDRLAFAANSGFGKSAKNVHITAAIARLQRYGSHNPQPTGGGSARQALAMP